MEFKLAQNTVANVISVVPTLDFYNVPHSVRTEEREAEEMEEKRLSGKRIASRLSRDVTRTDAQVVKGKHTGESIVLAAEQNDADLVVVGETGHRLLSKWILGSTSEYVLRHAPCSVWVSRHHRRADTFETSEREDVREEHDFGSLTSDVSDRDSDRLSS